MQIKHVHIPGTVVEIDADQQWSTCIELDCSQPIHSMLWDYDGDGTWHWTAWGPAPIPVGHVRPMGPAPTLPSAA